jgi:hypothetical protein
MKLFLAALTIWSFPFFGISCGSASVQNAPAPAAASTPAPSAETVTLTNQKLTGSFALQPAQVKNAPTMREVPPVAMMIEVPVTKVVNPNRRSVTVFVYLSRPNEKREEAAQKIDVGNFSLYPADRPGKFNLNPAPALRKAAEVSNDSNIKEWRLVFELEQKPEQALLPLEVTIAAPLWITTKG